MAAVEIELAQDRFNSFTLLLVSAGPNPFPTLQALGPTRLITKLRWDAPQLAMLPPGVQAPPGTLPARVNVRQPLIHQQAGVQCAMPSFDWWSVCDEEVLDELRRNEFQKSHDSSHGYSEHSGSVGGLSKSRNRTPQITRVEDARQGSRFSGAESSNEAQRLNTKPSTSPSARKHIG
jgi:hypothetical protein